MPCELLAFPSWLVVSHRYFFNPVWAQSIVAFSLSMHLFSGPQVVFYSASADSCSTNDSRRTQISGALCLQLSPLWYSAFINSNHPGLPGHVLCILYLGEISVLPLESPNCAELFKKEAQIIVDLTCLFPFLNGSLLH